MSLRRKQHNNKSHDQGRGASCFLAPPKPALARPGLSRQWPELPQECPGIWAADHSSPRGTEE